MRRPNLSVAISGSSGFLGQFLSISLKSRGCMVKQLIRSHPQKDTSREVYWNPISGHIERVGLEGVDVVINLAGLNMASKRWSASQKELLLKSRVQSTELLSRTLAKLKTPPQLFLSASAIGYYQGGFLGSLCEQWEAATGAAEKRGIRTVHLRTGVVLDPRGGFLAKQIPFFKWGLGAYLGSGQQFINWISLVDWIAACEHLIFNSQLSGAINITSPNPVSNLEFSKTLAQVLRRPCRLHIPENWVLWFFGEMGKSLMLEGSRILPTQLLEDGFEFEYSELQPALQACMAK